MLFNPLANLGKIRNQGKLVGMSEATRTEQEITFREFLQRIRQAKILFLVLVGTMSVGGVLIGLLGPKEYKATTTLMPVTAGGGSQLGSVASLASKYGGLASLAGISVPGSASRNEAIAVLKSQLLTRRFIRQNNLLPVLFASQWNVSSKKWRSTNPKKMPTLWLANAYFNNKIRTVVENSKTGLVKMTIEWKNPQQAAEWANGLVDLTNSYLRDKAIREATKNIAYLNSLLGKANVMQEQEVIYALMKEQIDKEMIARDSSQYALKVLDPAFAPERPSSRGPVLWGIFGLFVGMFLDVAVIFIQIAIDS